MVEREGSRRRPTGLLLVSLAGAAAAVTVMVTAAAVSHHDHEATPSRVQPGHAPPLTASQPDPLDPRTHGGIRDSVIGPLLSESDPVRVAVPSLGVTSSLVDLGLTVSGALEVPSDPAVAGWYTRGPAPGALGPAVIAGHVTWNGEPAVFYQLGALRRGDAVEVARSDGRTAVFGVQRVARFPKEEFPTRAVYGAVNYAALRLITCGGLYDESAHRYLDNVVVFARLLRVRPPPTRS